MRSWRCCRSKERASFIALTACWWIFFIALVYTVLILVIALVGGKLTRLGDWRNINQDSVAAIFTTSILLLLPLVWFLYFFIWEGATGTTPGKAIHFLRVIKKAGGKASWGQAAIRAFFSLLKNPANPSQDITIFVKVGDLPNQMKALFEGYTKSDIQVRLDDGTYAVISYRIRVTGRICETTSGNPCISSIEKIELFQVQQSVKLVLVRY